MRLINHTTYSSECIRALVLLVARDEGMTTKQLDTLHVDVEYVRSRGVRHDRWGKGRLTTNAGRRQQAHRSGLWYNRFILRISRHSKFAQAMLHWYAGAVAHEIAECMGHPHVWMKSRAIPGRYLYGRKKGEYWKPLVAALPPLLDPSQALVLPSEHGQETAA